ncbi:leucyl/phenylalanyl-tRNA--protein transferase [Thalassospira mesophila]|uniref:Leucyl/phenylalanyl-tRNA--protein transferase n=1 Tax=Thalassospira mesophila TaxID=1293891 RepID=A0A1Y2KYF5_9PROT|nr:leucyl/phenylalanyl-tRNA--protein transferase [Thalassospira mesophila]OSQ37176.1 leucyl/phenylalanyl-tRNA--protein transferase [Thalassospira mesophila]
MSNHLTPELLIRAYSVGLFPMAESHDDPTLYWIDPEWRGILPLDGFHVPRSLRRVVRRGDFTIRVDSDFSGTIAACAATTDNREETWINASIREAYCRLHQMGCAHSIEAWQDGELVGGLYGVSLGQAFFGESMFSRATNASKVALVHLVALMRQGGYQLLDTQFVNDHLKQFGVVEISREKYRAKLANALTGRASLAFEADQASIDAVLYKAAYPAKP